MEKKKTIEDLKKLYYNTQNQDRELFVKQYHHFRKIMCSTEYTIEEKDREFQNLAQAYIRCKLEESDIVTFQSISQEFEMRKMYEVTNGLFPTTKDVGIRPNEL